MTSYKPLAAIALATLLTVSVNAAADDQQCAAEVTSLVTKAPYKALNRQLKKSTLRTLTNALQATTDETSYQDLLGLANSIAAGAGSSGRLVITLPDGTVVVDTEKSNNSFANFQSKSINENHNSRIAILQSQMYPCGIGVETKFSTSTGGSENYVARRLGSYLKSLGTARISD